MVKHRKKHSDKTPVKQGRRNNAGQPRRAKSAPRQSLTRQLFFRWIKQ